MSAPEPPKFNLVQLFKDSTPNASINARILTSTFNLLHATTLAERDKGTVINIATMISRKMAAVWNHKQRFFEEQQKLVSELPQQPENPNLSLNIVLS
jgi:hypothetical protein